MFIINYNHIPTPTFFNSPHIPTTYLPTSCMEEKTILLFVDKSHCSSAWPKHLNLFPSEYYLHKDYENNVIHFPGGNFHILSHPLALDVSAFASIFSLPGISLFCKVCHLKQLLLRKIEKHAETIACPSTLYLFLQLILLKQGFSRNLE